MFFIIKAISVSEFRSLIKQKTFALLLIIFLSMALFSTYIGWSTKNTIMSVYNEAVKQTIAAGTVQIPANPFLSTAPLSILKNMTVYVFLIGALLAIIVGYSAFIRERRAGVSKIVFSKPISRFEFLSGKIAGILLALSLVIIASFFISLFSAGFIYGHMLDFASILRLFIFYAVSLAYIAVFAFFGLFFAIISKSESLALLAPIIIWIMISFVMPQLTLALDPTALLNPTNIQTALPQNDFLNIVRSMITPFSISENYKLAGRSLLQEDINSFSLWPIMAYLFAAIAGCFYAIKKFDVCENGIDE